MADPFREARLEPAEVRRILRRASELADADAETAAVERPLARTEVEALAEQLGIPKTAVARAIEGGEDAKKNDAPKGNWFIGAPTRILFEADLAGEPSSEEREELAEAIERALGQSGGTASEVGRTFTWRLVPSAGRGRDVTIRMRTKDGRTHLVVEERLTQLATGLFVGIGVGAGVGPMGGYIALIAAIGVLGVVAPLLWIPLMLLLARTIYGAVSRKRERQLRDLVARITSKSADWSRAPERTRVAGDVRVAVPEEATEEEEGELDAPARAERRAP
jgi:hypothetical protein